MEISQNVGAVRMFDQVCRSLTRRKMKKKQGGERENDVGNKGRESRQRKGERDMTEKERSREGGGGDMLLCAFSVCLMPKFYIRKQ